MTVKLTPLHDGEMIKLSGQSGNVYERQILPFGKFNYQGHEFDINSEWADNAIKAFKDRAVAQAWFALADENNSHEVDNRPDRFGGEIIDLIKTDKGLTGRYKLTDKAAQVVDENPKLGVSARFTTNYTRESDNKKWPVVIDQVLGTLNPKIINTDEWKRVALSNVDENETVEDSSGEVWKMPEDDTKSNVTLKREEYDQLMALLAKSKEEPETETTDKEIDELLNALEGQTDPNIEKVKVGLSNADKRIAELTNQVATARWEKEAHEYKSNGVPPAIVELARPVLSSYDEVKVVTLSEDGSSKTSDARTVVRNILDELTGTVKLSQEDGHSFSNGSSKNNDALDKELEALKKSIQGDLDLFGN